MSDKLNLNSLQQYKQIVETATTLVIGHHKIRYDSDINAYWLIDRQNNTIGVYKSALDAYNVLRSQAESK